MKENTCSELNCFPHHPADCMLTKYDELGVALLELRVEVNRALLRAIETITPDKFSGIWFGLLLLASMLGGIAIGMSL